MQPYAANSQPPALASGVVLRNRYEIEGYISGGGFGHIYRARDIALGHQRAIKEAFARDQNTQRQFQLEAEFLLNARHPNLVRGYAVFETGGRLYLVMDYVDGHTLEDLAIETIKRTHRPPVEAQVLDWVLPICGAVQELHSQPAPIIHRDIKPANIKLSVTQGIPVLIDLGLAKLYAQGQQTIAAALAFTPGYAPPEQYQAAGTTDRRTDIYGLGATLYYLLTGYQPVEAPARISAQALPTPRERNPLLSERVDALVLRAMALDPNERFQSATDLERELAACRAELGATPPSIVTLIQRWCPQCGGSSPAEARFCMRCGQSLWAEPWQTAPVAAIHVTAEPQPAPVGVNGRATQPPELNWPAAKAQQPARNRERAQWRPQGYPAGRPAAQAAAFVAPHAVWRRPETWITPLDGAPPATSQEALVSLTAFLAVVCIALSLAAPFAPAMTAFTLPGIALGIWSIVHAEETNAPREFRWLAVGALLLGSIWLVALVMHLAAIAH